MNRKLFELSDLDEHSNKNVYCKNCSVREGKTIPECISGDYCVETPRNMNGGILTLAFVDMQPLETVYQTETAFCNGTLFPNNDKPFFGGRKR